jgi:predicted Zn-dependent protease
VKEKKILKQVLKKSKKETEILLIKEELISLRFFRNEVHQPTKETNSRVGIRIIDNKRIGFSATNSLLLEAVLSTLLEAEEICKHSPIKKDFPSLPKPSPLLSHPKTFDEATLNLEIEALSSLLISLLKKCKRESLEASGNLQIEKSTISVLNSHGMEREEIFTQAEFQIILERKGNTSFSSGISKSFFNLEIEKIFHKAREKLSFPSKKIEDFKSQKYRTILEPEAVADILSFLSYLGFSALSFQEGRSFFRPGEKMLSDKVDIWDEGLDKRTLTMPFDFEGVPKKKVIIFEKGVAKNLVYDTYTAFREGKSSTGHALPYPNPVGPLPLHLFMSKGDKSIQEMIEEEEKAILVTRFFYINVEDPINTILTGMTRDGTFLIEKGKIKGRLPNLRFTQSALEAFKNVLEVGERRELKKGNVSICFVPPLKVGNFNFTGYSEKKKWYNSNK